MIEIRKQTVITTSYPLRLLGQPEKILFFDIETTGFSAYDSALYLIGCVYYRAGSFEFRQFLAESLSQEVVILKAFFELCSEFDTLVHFNGDTFDIRYLENTAAQYRLQSPLRCMKSIDILKRVRKHKKVFGLENLKQKTIEKFLGIFREDMYSGGELIQVYENYSKSRKDDLLQLLLLHNEEDVMDMVRLLPILSYTDTLEDPLRFLKVTDALPGPDLSSLQITLETPFRYPAALSFFPAPDTDICFREQTVSVRLPVFAGTLKYFYPDPENYFYLPAEDRVIHKKIARYVDREHREPAAKDNCFIPVSGIFAKALCTRGETFYYSDFKTPPAYVRLDDENGLEHYLDQLLKGLSH